MDSKTTGSWGLYWIALDIYGEVDSEESYLVSTHPTRAEALAAGRRLLRRADEYGDGGFQVAPTDASDSGETVTID